jgi:hypothetical protein
LFERLLIKKLTTNLHLVIFGAKGVGKTTLVNQWAKNFGTYLYLNLAETADRHFFVTGDSWDETLQSIYFLKDKSPRGTRNLVFLDEIQHCPEAVSWFRQTPAILKNMSIVATASVCSDPLAELVALEKADLSILNLHPFTFEEFLLASGDTEALETWQEVPAPASASAKLLRYFHIYTLIGGMPEIVNAYMTDRHLSGLKPFYEYLLNRYLEEISAKVYGNKRSETLQFILQNAFPYAATRIKFNRFGNSGYRSRETGTAFKMLEKHFLLRLIYPSTQVTFPAIPDRAKFPRLQFLDTGLVNYFSGIQKQLYLTPDMSAIFHGQIARQAVGQEIIATESQNYIAQSDPRIFPMTFQHDLHFWVRDKAQSGAEVDFVLPYNNFLIPVVVRPGEPGRLRSLHQFMDVAPHPYAVRLHAGVLGIQQTQTIKGKKYFLLSLPYFLAGKIREHIEGFRKLVEG